MGSPLAYEREGLDIRHIRELFGNPDLTRLKSDDVALLMPRLEKKADSAKVKFAASTSSSNR